MEAVPSSSKTGPANGGAPKGKEGTNKPFKRNKNATKRTTAYGHGDAKDIKNLKAAIRRGHKNIKKQMDNLFDLCGVPSFFMFSSEIPVDNAQHHSYISPFGKTRRPVIPQPIIDTIGKALQDTFKYHEKNTDFGEGSHIIHIPKDDAVSIVKRYMKQEGQESKYDDIEMFADSLGKKCTSAELIAMATVANQANVTIKFESKIKEYERRPVVAYVLLMLTILNLDDVLFFMDESDDSALKAKIKLLQKQVKSCYVLENESPAYIISADFLEELVIETADLNVDGQESSEGEMTDPLGSNLSLTSDDENDN